MANKTITTNTKIRYYLSESETEKIITDYFREKFGFHPDSVEFDCSSLGILNGVEVITSEKNEKTSETKLN